MKKIDNARYLILKGITFHLRGNSLKKINSFYDLSYKKLCISEQDISFVNYFTLAIIRNRGVIEIILAKYIKKKLPKNVLEIKAGLMLGIAQIFFSKIPTYALVNSTVNLFEGKLKKWRGLANAVLRKVDRESNKLKKIVESQYLNVPDWLYIDWKKQFGETKTHKFLENFQLEPDLDLRVKNKVDYWVKELKGKKLGINTVRVKGKGKITNIKGYEEGLWWVQDIAAQLPVIIMGDIKNKKVLDLCAAPGGKTAQMLSEGAFVEAIDSSKSRVNKLVNNINRLKLAKKLKVNIIDIENYSAKEKFDIVLLDAPCSSTGTFRKNPDVLWIKNKNDVKRNSNLQKKLIIKSLGFVKKGGVLIYSNCSMQFEEGETLIEELVKKKLIQVDKISKKEVTDYPEEIINKGLIRTLPYMYNGGNDGFFIARIKK